jgi:hypothetical protein
MCLFQFPEHLALSPLCTTTFATYSSTCVVHSLETRHALCVFVVGLTQVAEYY